MDCLREIRVCAIVLFACGLLAAQDQPATVTFSLDFPHSDPSHYVISISSNRTASYEGNGRLTPVPNGSNPDPEPASRVEFTASDDLVRRVFDLAKQANYFAKDVDLKKGRLAFTGDKVLGYKDGQHTNEVKYNYSVIPAVQQLTRIFQSLSSTIEFGRRLEYDHRHQKLALNDDLKYMEEAAKGGDLEELGSVAPILQKIVDDKSVINVVRARAQRLLLGAQ
jgi:hypothetical protein